MQALKNPRGMRATLALAALAASVVASAGTQTDSFDSRVGGIDLLTNNSASFSLSGFDTSLGTLTSVTFVFTGDVFSTVEYFNNRTSGSQSVRTDLDYGLTLKESSSGTNIIDLARNESLTVDNLPYQNGGTLDYSTAQTKNNASYSLTTTNPILLALASSASSFNFDLTSFDLSMARPVGNNVDVDYFTSMRVTGQVQYAYQPVPEPASMAALGVGVLGLVRRRARKAGAR